jgi:hypothetical protein
MAWFKYLKSTESINSSTTNSSYSYPYCKRFIGRFTPRDTLEANTWIFASILDININTYKDTSLEDQTDETSYIVTYEKGDNVHPVETVIEGDFIYFKTYELHTAAEEITGQYAVYYNTPNLRKLNEVDNAGTDDYQVNLAPVWEDLELAPFIYGDSYLDGPSAIGTVYSISSGALPNGLSISSSTGQITGTVGSDGEYSFTVRATTDDGKYYNEATFSGTVYEDLQWSDSTLFNIDYNTAYLNQVEADGYPAATYSISSGELPSGITLNSVTGLVSGTTLDSGAYSFTIKAENAIGSISQSFSGTVQSPPSWSDETLGAIIQGVAYNDGVSAAGTATITYSVYSGSLPSGLSLNSSTGAITGTTGSTGSYSFTIRATNAWGYISKTFAEGIYTTPAWTDSTIANMIYGQAYSDAVAASGYPAVTYSISTGALPSGITLNSSTGAIAGTSTTAGSYSFTVKAENAVSNVTQLFTDDLYVTPSWTDNILAAFTYNTAYSDQVVATGTPTYTISSGTLPTGLSLNSSTGAVTGTPTYYGAYSFIIQADNETGSVTQSFSGAIDRTPSWTDNTLANINYNIAYSDSVAAIGYPTITYSISSGALPTGISLNSSTGAVTGTSTQSGSYSFTIRAENTAGNVTQSFSGTIQTPPSWSDETLGIITQDVVYSDGISATGTATIVYSVYSGSLPTGLSLNTSTGAITGTTSSTGSYSFTIRATNTWGYAEKAFSGTIYTAPAWTDSTIANMIYGQAYSDAVAASGYPAVTYSISAGALPSGITLNSSTGAITGTSTTAGSYSFTVRAENAVSSVTQSFTDSLFVTPSWTDQTLAAFTYNTAYSDEVVATGSPTYTISSGTLPTGLSLGPTFNIGDTGPGGGRIFITPSTIGNSTGRYFEVALDWVEVTRTWATGANQSALVTGANGTAIGTGAQNTIDIVNQSGNVAATSAAVYCSDLTYNGYSDWFLPSKDELNEIYVNRIALAAAFSTNYYWSSSQYSSNGARNLTFNSGNQNNNFKSTTYFVRPVRSFTASAGAVIGASTYFGAYSFTVQAANETGSVTQSFSGAINRAPSWTDNTLATPIYNTAYSDSVVAIGYPTPTYSVTTGTLPTGLSLNSSSGAVTGTTTATGSHSFTITASNTEGSISQAFSFDINLAPTWNDETLGTPTYNNAYSDGVSSNTAYPAVTYSISAGSLPSGFSINSSTGAITGTYTTPVNDSSFSYTFTVKAENTVGNVAKEFTWSISIPFTVSGGSSYNAGTGYSARSFTANGTFEILTGKKNIEVLIIPGGGGGGGGANSNDWYGTGDTYAPGGGGAASETFTPTLDNTTVGSYPVVVGAGGAGGARAYVQTPSGNAAPSTATASDGSSGGNSTFQVSGTTYNASGAQGGGKGTATSGGNNPSGVYYNYAASGGFGAGNSLYAFRPGVLIDNQITAGSGGSGLGSRGSAPALYYTGGPGGSSVTTWNLTIGYGGDGGSYASRAAARIFAGSGGSGGSGVNSSSSGPGNAGYRGQVIVRWAT